MNQKIDPTDVINAASAHLARRFSGDINEEANRASKTKVLQSISRPASGGLRLSPALWASSLVALGAAVWFALPRPLTVVSDKANWREGGDFSAGATPAALAFSDGSRLTIAPGTSGRVQRLDRHGADLGLKHGHIDLRVVPSEGTRWNVHAGPYRVRVTGTRFGVQWDDKSQAFSIEMFEGHVVVEGPGLVPPRALSAGESLQMGPTVTPGPINVPDAVRADANREEPHVANVPTVSPTAAPVRATKPAHHTDPEWSKKISQGNYKEVLQDAYRRDLNHVLARGSLDDLGALADAARYAGDPALAKRSLQAQRKRFAKSERATMATYLLGRLAEDAGQANEAVGWYDLYIKSPGRSPLAEESLGRKMLSLERAGRLKEANETARAYKQQYPNGSFFDAASRIQSQKP